MVTFAADPHGSAHEFDQRLDDVEAEPGAPVAADAENPSMLRVDLRDGFGIPPEAPEHVSIESAMAKSPGCHRDPRSRPSRAGRRSRCHQLQTALASVS